MGLKPKSRTKPAAWSEGDATPRERIYDASLRCFQRQGVRRSTMEDIAREAGMSRPTIYYYYKDKQALILDVVVRQQAESHRVQAEQLAGRFCGLVAIVEAALLGIEGAIKNPSSAELARPENEHLTALALRSPEAMEVQAAFWAPMLADARERGELRADLGDDEIIHWIVFLQFNMVSCGSMFGFEQPEAIRLALFRFLAPALNAAASTARAKSRGNASETG